MAIFNRLVATIKSAAVSRIAPDIAQQSKRRFICALLIQGLVAPYLDFLATVCRALGVDPTQQNQSNVGRPIRIVDKAAQPVKEVLA